MTGVARAGRSIRRLVALALGAGLLVAGCATTDAPPIRRTGESHPGYILPMDRPPGSGVTLATSGASPTPTAPAPPPATGRPPASPSSGGEVPSSWPPFTGVKKRLAVIRLENKVKTPFPDPSWQIGEGLTEMLTSELFRTGRFTMVERSAIADLVKEQELGQTGLVRKETAAKVGEMLGAQLLVAGAITEFEASQYGGGAGIGFKGLGLQLTTNVAHVGVDIRLVDSSTGQIVKSQYAEGKATDTGIGLAGKIQGVTFGSDAFMKTPLGQATREAMARAVAFIVGEMETVPWTGRVVQVKDGEVFVNAGTNMNLRTGTALMAYSKGEDLVDPTTGLGLGSRDTLVGTVTLTQVEEKFSVGTFTGQGILRRGDLLKLGESVSAQGGPRPR